jgi:lipoprotein-releasing system ATP-binding protein
MADSRETGASPLVAIEALSKGYETNGIRIDVLQSTDLTLATGETMAVVGASGIGKSTLLHILGTLDRPDAGTFLFKGEDVLAFDPDRTARFRNRSIGFVFQFHHLLPEFNSLENAMMPALISGMGRQQARDRAESILVRVGLKDRLKHRVVKLSGGEQQRVALARALVLSPPLLLADEPTGNLDRKSSDRVHELLLELNRELAMTLVVVTHNSELASYMSRRVTIVDGKLVDTN